MNILLSEVPYLLNPAPQPKIRINQSFLSLPCDRSLNNAPPQLEEWVGREEILSDLDEDWSSSNYRVTGLIGFGGEGKSCLASEWLYEILDSHSKPQPCGVFWWGFYDRRNVDEFFEAAFNFMFGGQIGPYQVPSSSAKACLIGGMLNKGRYLFVLDGLDVIQYQEGDQYGMLKT